jgi:lipopolysaccharide cholinephosphotransferase
MDRSVAGIVRHCQLIQLRLLRTFRDICRAHRLAYWLDGGTLLGAIRHSGFIPWDDDVDVAMPRPDYELFRKIASSELPGDMFLQTHETDTFPRLEMMKIRDRYSAMIEHERFSRHVTYHQGIYIDIFPVDKIGKKTAAFAARIANIFNWVVRYRGVHLSPRQKAKQVAVFFRDRIIGYERALRFFRMAFAPLDLGSEAYWHFQIFKCKTFPRLLLEDVDIFPLGEISFEKHLFSAPRNVHKYLTCMYGDYMTLPPVEQRVHHSFQIIPFLHSANPEIPS